MGTWAEGVFENDAAVDHVYDLLDKMIEQILKTVGDPVKLEPDEDDSNILLCNVDLLGVVADHVCRQVWSSGTWDIRGPLLPAAEEILAWKAAYLMVWDRAIDGLDPSPAYKTGRRAQIVAAFDRLAALSRRQDGGPAAPGAAADTGRM